MFHEPCQTESPKGERPETPFDLHKKKESLTRPKNTDMLTLKAFGLRYYISHARSGTSRGSLLQPYRVACYIKNVQDKLGRVGANEV